MLIYASQEEIITFYFLSLSRKTLRGSNRNWLILHGKYTL